MDSEIKKEEEEPTDCDQLIQIKIEYKVEIDDPESSLNPVEAKLIPVRIEPAEGNEPVPLDNIRIAPLPKNDEWNHRERWSNHECSYCKKLYYNLKSLRNHERGHTNKKKQHSCSDCNKEFKTATELKRHLRMHNGEKPYVCSYCKNGFTDVSNLKRHERVHTGEKPFSCSDCGKQFTTSTKMQAHNRKFHTEFTHNSHADSGISSV